MEVRVKVDGRGQSFQAALLVDPKDQLDAHMKRNTHFWKQFMTGTTPKCLMMVQNKGQDEGEVVHPENFGKDFYSNNIFDKAQVTLYEISKIPQNDDDEFEDYDEGGEDENEEMEEELEEQEQQIEVEPVAV